MQADPDDLRHYYRSLSDGELLALDDCCESYTWKNCKVLHRWKLFMHDLLFTEVNHCLR